MELVVNIYDAIKYLPYEEKYALADQIKRAAISIPSNIAEGASRNSTKEFIQFLYIALGSSSELETLILIAQRVGYLDDIDDMLSKIDSIKKMLNALLSSLKRKLNNVKK